MREAQALFGLRVKDMARGHAAGKLDDLQPRQIACVLSCATPALPACDLLDLGGELEPWMKHARDNRQSPQSSLLSAPTLACLYSHALKELPISRQCMCNLSGMMSERSFQNLLQRILP